MSINIPMTKAQCGVCTKAFEDDMLLPLVRVTPCGHLYHKDCLFDNSKKHIKVTEKMMKICCPRGCKKPLVNAKKNEAFSELAKKVESIDFSRAKMNSSKGIRYVGYLAVAFVVVTLALVIHTSLLAIGIGLVLSVPIGWLVGKGIDRALAPSRPIVPVGGGGHG